MRSAKVVAGSQTLGAGRTRKRNRARCAAEAEWPESQMKHTARVVARERARAPARDEGEGRRQCLELRDVATVKAVARNPIPAAGRTRKPNRVPSAVGVATLRAQTATPRYAPTAKAKGGSPGPVAGATQRRGRAPSATAKATSNRDWPVGAGTLSPTMSLHQTGKTAAAPVVAPAVSPAGERNRYVYGESVLSDLKQTLLPFLVGSILVSGPGTAAAQASHGTNTTPGKSACTPADSTNPIDFSKFGIPPEIQGSVTDMALEGEFRELIESIDTIEVLVQYDKDSPVHVGKRELGETIRDDQILYGNSPEYFRYLIPAIPLNK